MNVFVKHCMHIFIENFYLKIKLSFCLIYTFRDGTSFPKGRTLVSGAGELLTYTKNLRESKNDLNAAQ